MYVFTLRYTQIQSYTLITFIYSVCFWGYVSVFESMYVHTLTPNNTQIHSNTLKTFIYSAFECMLVYVNVMSVFECMWV
jgi:hypothetical protein